MRNGQNNKRMRGRSNNNNQHQHQHHRKNQNPMSRVFESNGPDVKIRGNPSHIAEKYVQLARDAQSSGDPVSAENYYQHAEHYNRLIAAAQEQFRQHNPQFTNRPETDMRSDMRDDAFDDGDDDDGKPGNQQPMQRQRRRARRSARASRSPICRARRSRSRNSSSQQPQQPAPRQQHGRAGRAATSIGCRRSSPADSRRTPAASRQQALSQNGHDGQPRPLPAASPPPPPSRPAPGLPGRRRRRDDDRRRDQDLALRSCACRDLRPGIAFARTRQLDPPGDGASAGSSAGTSRRRSRRAGIAR